MNVFSNAVILVLLSLPLVSHAKQPRSAAVKAEFQRATPCPATGEHRGKCPGYVIDHVMPLCAGGPDHASNMQWQTVEDAKIKDRDERRTCRTIKRKG